MGLFSAIKEKWNNWYYHDLDDLDDDELDWEIGEEDFLSKPQKITSDEKLNRMMQDDEQRNVYVLECLGQMAEASDKMEQCDAEYEAVTSLLLDMEVIESLSNEDKADIKHQRGGIRI